MAETAITSDELDAVCGRSRIDRHVGRAGFQNAVERHRQLEPLVHVDADAISRTHALVDQNIGELVRLTDELLVSQARAFETERLVRGIALDAESSIE